MSRSSGKDCPVAQHEWTDRSPDDAAISLEPYYLTIRTGEREKPVPCHRILRIMYDGVAAFENRKIRGLADRIRESAAGP